MSDAKTPWGGRFEKSPAAFLADFGNSLPVDQRMWAEDIRGSIAHAREKRHYRIEGKDYVVRDGDVLLFKFHV